MNWGQNLLRTAIQRIMPWDRCIKRHYKALGGISKSKGHGQQWIIRQTRCESACSRSYQYSFCKTPGPALCPLYSGIPRGELTYSSEIRLFCKYRPVNHGFQSSAKGWGFSASSFPKHLMSGAMEGIHHISRKKIFGGNNSLPTLGLLLFLDIREFLH